MSSFHWPHFRFSHDVCIFMLFIRFCRNTVTAMQAFTRSGSNVDVFTSRHVAPIAKLSLQVVTLLAKLSGCQAYCLLKILLSHD